MRKLEGDVRLVARGDVVVSSVWLDLERYWYRLEFILRQRLLPNCHRSPEITADPGVEEKIYHDC